jgi:hypothetical protein
MSRTLVNATGSSQCAPRVRACRKLQLLEPLERHQRWMAIAAHVAAEHDIVGIDAYQQRRGLRLARSARTSTRTDPRVSGP